MMQRIVIAIVAAAVVGLTVGAAHGGHFAIVTGRHVRGGADGMADWMVNNFYNLGSFSAKGITAAMLPMDNYMADVNSGQSWYRPSYMLVAVLKTDRAAYAYQGAISRVYHHLYRQDFFYRHAGANCAGISMDTLRTLGWNIPMQGPTSTVKAIAAYPYKSIADMSFASGKQAYDYMIEEQSRLYPVASIDEYMKRVPEDKAQWKIVPVDPRPFPRELVEPDTLKDTPMPPWLPAGGFVLIAGLLSLRVMRMRRARASFIKIV